MLSQSVAKLKNLKIQLDDGWYKSTVYVSNSLSVHK